MADLRAAAQQALEALENLSDCYVGDHDSAGECASCHERSYRPHAPDCKKQNAITTLRAALAQQEQATGKDSLQVPQHVADQLTTADLAWLETRRLVRIWKELGQLRWTGADQGWDMAIEAVRARLDKECQDVLAWKEKVEASGQTAAQLLQKLQKVKDD